MRILFAIPHFVRPGGMANPGQNHGSLAMDPSPRVRALTACINALHQQFNSGYAILNHGAHSASFTRPAQPAAIDVVICTTGDSHVIGQLQISKRCYSHFPSAAEPLSLGFVCHDILRNALGRYDFYCYLEDDLVLNDPWFFRKLIWFSRFAGADKLLQPNRYESGTNHIVPKLYLDGDLEARVTSVFQDVTDSPPLAGEWLGFRVPFRRTLNPHSGCFFLNAEQMSYWSRRPHFADRASRFIGPLETCATLGIMRTFRVYRTEPEFADFLEVQHHGTGYIDRLCLPQTSEPAS